MKRKILAIALVGAISLTGCGSSGTDNTENTTNEQSSQSEDTTIEDTEQQKPINISAQDSTIIYQYFENDADKFNKDSIVPKFENDVYEDNLLPLVDNQDIKIDFGSNNPKKVYVKKTYLNKDDTTKTDKEDLKLDENFVVNIKTEFKSKDIKACLYEVVAEYEGLYVCYAFGIKNADYIDDSKNIVGFLSEADQKTYDDFKNTFLETGDKASLKNLNPILISQFLVQALMEKEYGVAYALYAPSDALPTEYDYSMAIKDLSKAKKLEYIEGLKKAKDGKFVEEEKDKKGYVQYEPTPDHPMALDFVKNDDTWQIVYMPVTE